MFGAAIGPFWLPSTIPRRDTDQELGTATNHSVSQKWLALNINDVYAEERTRGDHLHVRCTNDLSFRPLVTGVMCDREIDMVSYGITSNRTPWHAPTSTGTSCPSYRTYSGGTSIVSGGEPESISMWTTRSRSRKIL